MVLGLMSVGEQYEIEKISHCGSCTGKCEKHGPMGHAADSTPTRAEEMGLRVGKQVKMLQNEGNLLLVLVDNARIALDRRMAMKIRVRR